MLGMITGLFKSSEEKAKKVLRSKVTKKVEQVVPVKAPYYHEIVDDEVRIYSRKDGLVETVKSEKPAEKALELLAKWGKK